MSFTISAERPVALESVDHLHPLGAMRDNSLNRAFNARLYELAPSVLAEVSVLDLGCSGGGFVKSLLDEGVRAVGVEGSDYSRVHQRAEWATIPGNLFTADATAPFQVYDDGPPARFAVVTAWEFFEHIAEADLPAVFGNIARHLAPGGLVIGSVNTLSSPNLEGIEMHATIRPAAWWNEKLAALGYARQPALERHFGRDWVRTDPGSFHVVLRRAPCSP